ncbi:MAG: S8 family serine peptidase [Neobacillus sp.]
MSKKNYNKKRKIATYALASTLVLSNLGLVSPVSADTYKPGDLDSKIKELSQQKARDSFKAQVSAATSAKAGLKATDKVRVIIEVDGQTPVEFATEQGVLYKELSEDKKSSLASKLQTQQKSVKDQIAAKGVAVKYNQQYTTAFNGFSGEVAFGDLAKIEAVAGVKNVYLANEYNRPVVEPNMKTSHQFVQSKETWANSGYKGEGMVVAVIDTGVDPSHKDFKLTSLDEDGLSKAEVDQIVQDNSLKGKFFTDKVPYGYNYFDQNSTILDLGPGASMHGMHVAGTVAANGDEENGGVKGVAPEAQVLAMKVFSNDPNFGSTWSDVYLAAIDDSIKLGADVLNMSLGSVAAFYDEDSAEDLAIQRAVANGIVSAVSAGNSNHIGDGWDNPYAQNPDIGVVGAPGLNPDTISVAASGNEAYLYQHNVSIDGVEGFTGVGYGIDDWTQLLASHGGSLELVSLGSKLGAPADYAGVDVKGKVVVVPRGGLTFYDKTVNAANAGAAGIIVWNATNGFFYEDQGGWDVPFMKVSKAEGEAINAAIAAGNTTLRASQSAKSESPEMGRMTAFTSWGTTPSLEMKPEITAPGGNIYSTVNDDKYTVMSGTSMAAPHVAGGSALVQQYLQNDERFSDLSVSERTAFAKVLLMNTANVIEDLNGQPFSPRRQGAGMMQLQSAVTTPVYVVNKADGEAKVELKDFQQSQFSMTFTAQNISDKDVTYAVNTDVLTDTIQNYGDAYPEYNALIAGDLEGAVVDAPETVTVPAGGSVDFTVSVNFANAKIPGLDADGNETLLDLRNNIFIEGSVNLTAADETVPALTVPYVGFYGKWDEPKIVDGFATLGEDRFLDLSYVFKGGTDVEVDEMYFGAPVPEKNFFALSPNADGYLDSINPIPSFLRNAAEAQYNILDENGNQLRRVKAEADVIKNAVDGDLANTFNYKADRIWDGKVKGAPVADGLYYYEIKSIIDYEGARWQSKKIPVYVDTTAPEVSSTYDANQSTVVWETVENGTGLEEYWVFVNGERVATVDGKTTSLVLENAPEKAIVQVVAWDYAGNYGTDTAAIGDVEIPLVFVDTNTTVPYGAYNSFTVPVAGYVTDDIGVKAVKVNGQVVPTTVKDGKVQFATTVTYNKDGAFDVLVEVIDHSNKSFSIARKIYVDTTKPVINVNAPERVDKNVEEVTLDVNLQDNFNYLNFFVGEDHEFEVPFKSPVDVLTPLNKNYQVTVPLVEGENVVTLRATDLSGNETVTEVVINRADAELPVGWVEEDGVWYFYNEDGSLQKGWFVDEYEEGWGVTYYFDLETGAMHTGWLEEEGSRYYFDESGAMVTDYTFVPENKNWFYFDENGAAVTGIVEMYGDYAYFDAKTGLLKSSWKLVDGSWYLADSYGTLKTGWAQDKGGVWYYFNNEAKMQTGWVHDGKAWYFLKSSGAMATGWVKDGKNWYFLKSSGAMATGWVLDAGKWYYLNSGGSMATGWKLVGGKWYYFYSNGAMAASTTINGYKLGKDGAWIK